MCGPEVVPVQGEDDPLPQDREGGERENVDREGTESESYESEGSESEEIIANDPPARAPTRHLADADNEDEEAARIRERRARLLKDNLVTRYRNAKHKPEFERIPEEPKKGAGHYISTGIDHLTRLGSAAVEGETMYSNYKGWQGEKVDEKTDTGFAIGSMVNSGVAALNGIYKAHQQTKKIEKMKNEKKKAAARKSRWGSYGSIAAGLFSGATAGTKYLGKNKDSDTQKKWTRGLGATAAVFDMAGNFMSMLGGSSMNSEYGRIATASGAWNEEVRNTLRRDPDHEKNLKDDINDPDKAADRATNIQAKNAFKAKKYGMVMAQDFNEIKARQIVKGGFGFARSLVSGANSLTKAFASSYFLKSKGGSLLSLVLNATSALLKYGGMFAEYQSDKNAAKDINNKKIWHIDRYITDKSNNLNVAENEIFEGVDDAERGQYGDRELSRHEKERIVVARLGVNIPIIDKEIDGSDKLKAFKLLALKRAANIKYADKDTRENMLDALGLPHNAEVEDIAAAMTGE